jgi:RecA-family ATPase
MTAFERLAKETGATVLVIHHVHKGAAKNNSQDIHAGRGSTVFFDHSRFQLNLSHHRKKGNGNGNGNLLKLSVNKNSNGPDNQSVILERLGNGTLKYVAQDSGADIERALADSIVEFVKPCVDKGEFIKKSDLAKRMKESGFTSASANRVNAALANAIHRKLLSEVDHPSHHGSGRKPLVIVTA